MYSWSFIGISAALMAAGLWIASLYDLSHTSSTYVLMVAFVAAIMVCVVSDFFINKKIPHYSDRVAAGGVLGARTDDFIWYMLGPKGRTYFGWACVLAAAAGLLYLITLMFK